MTLLTPNFEAFTLKANGGRLNQIVTDVGVSLPFNPDEGRPIPEPKVYRTKGVWDTGATSSVITKQTAIELGLIATSIVQMTHAGGVSDVNAYIVNLYLPNRVMIHTISVLEMENAGGFGMLIGMDVITLGDFSLTNYNGQTTFSFRYPSMTETDYVSDHIKLTSMGQPGTVIGRNELCPCNSGKKYKNCHGRKSF